MDSGIVALRHSLEAAGVRDRSKAVLAAIAGHPLSDAEAGTSEAEASILPEIR